MSWQMSVGIFVVIWSVVLFAVLPIGIRTQQEDDNVTPGSAPSAPVKPRIMLKFLATTAITMLIIGAGLLAEYLGFPFYRLYRSY